MLAAHALGLSAARLQSYLGRACGVVGDIALRAEHHLTRGVAEGDGEASCAIACSLDLSVKSVQCDRAFLPTERAHCPTFVVVSCWSESD